MHDYYEVDYWPYDVELKSAGTEIVLSPCHNVVDDEVFHAKQIFEKPAQYVSIKQVDIPAQSDAGL